MIEGPYYADRVNGRLTFRDWDSWEPKDQDLWGNVMELHNEIDRLRAALQAIADMAPATAEMTLAHSMAQEAETALAQASPEGLT